MNDTTRLAAIRSQIDMLDEQLQVLITERAALALEVGNIKRGSADESVFYRPEREAQILQKVIAQNKGPLSTQQITLIFRNILTACLNLQHPITVAALGPEGTFSQAAVFKHFGIETHTQLTTSIDQVFIEVEAGKVDYGVVPIENSTTGVINQVLDMLRTSALTICGEIILPIHHHLLAADKSIKKIQRVYGHEQALMQCQQWLAQHLPTVEKISVSSNAQAAKLAKQEKNAAGIAGELAVQWYDLQIVEKNIEDNPQNETRFLILGRQKVNSSGNDKTSLLISTPHTPGALIDLLNPFAENNINISLIESRPSRDCNWAYFFFIDIDGHQEDENVKQALEKLTKKSILLHLLGSYPKAIL